MSLGTSTRREELRLEKGIRCMSMQLLGADCGGGRSW